VSQAVVPAAPFDAWIFLTYGQRHARRTIVLDDVANRTALETSVSAAELPMLQEMRLVKSRATQAT
jgi:hypothetical protein